MRDRKRRAVLGTTGAALATALAGCNDLLGGGGGGDDDDGTATETTTEGPGGNETETAGGTETPGETETETVNTPPDDAEPESGPAAVDRWLTESSVGGEASNYDGEFTDLTDQAAAEIAVGAEGNGGNFAFSPVAAVVSPDTEIRWEWTGEGGPHNVYADREAQIGVTDFEFNSGEPQSGAGVTFVRSLSEPGVALYHCEPHLGRGMKGGILVREDS